MTWIVGTAVPVGYAVGISDIRVTFADRSERDCLQKIYPMGRFIAAGFAGSVKVGFAMLDALARLLHNPEPAADHAFLPEEVVNSFSPLAQEVYRRATQSEQVLRSHLMLLGADPRNIEGWPLGRCSVHVLRSPEFTPEAAEMRRIVSIGSGSSVPAYAEMLSNITGDPLILMRGEMMGAQMGHLPLTMAIQRMVEDNPIPGISRHAHICDVRRGRVAIAPNDHRTYPPTGEVIEFQMPPVARSWAEFARLASEGNFSPFAAAC